MMWTVRSLLDWTITAFRERGIDSARLDAELLLADVLGMDRLHLFLNYARPATEPERTAYRARVQARLRGLSVAAIVGYREFYSRRFRVGTDVLVPRPETELLIDLVLQDTSGPGRFVDVGTGCGCIGLTLAAERAECAGVLVDQSRQACVWADRNRSGLHLEKRVEVLQANALDPLFWQMKPFDLVLSNPPYLTAAEYSTATLEVKTEPQEALLYGDSSDGADWFRKFIPLLPKICAAGAWIGMETGIGQAPEVVRLLAASGAIEMAIHQDYSHRDRVVTARWPSDFGV